jgi:hypothetical protein
MKKNILFGGMLLLAAAFTGCSEDFKDWANPITNPQPEAITIPGVSASAAATNIDLAEAEDDVKLISLSTATFPAGTTLDKMRIVLTPTDVEEAEPKTLQAISTTEGTFSKEALQEIIVDNYGRRPDVRSFDAQVYLDGIYNGQAAYIDAGTVNLTLIPEAPYIAPAYYIIGGPNDWQASAINRTIKFNHSSEDVYVDPIFTVVFDAAAGDTWFAIGDDQACDAIEAGDWNQLYGIVGGESEAKEGKIARRSELGGENSFCVKGAKKIRVTIDMMEQTFKVEAVNIAEAYYLIGGPISDWAASATGRLQKFSHSDKDVFDDPVFTYVFEGSGSDMWFAFGDDESCDGIANGDWSKVFGTTLGDGNSGFSGTYARRTQLSDNGSFKVDGKAKFYRFTINALEQTYEITPLNFEPYIYFIGATDGWANAEQKLALTDDSGIYTGYLYCADPNGWGNEFKFQKTPGNWDTQVNADMMTGGITGDFVAGGGGNFKANAGESVYYVTLNMADMSINGVKVDKMGIIGDFNGWGTDLEMTWNANDYCYEVTGATVNANGWKFRVNGDWGINLGGNDSVEPSTVIDDLVANGKNLGVVGATIKLYPTRKTTDKIYCTVE